MKITDKDAELYFRLMLCLHNYVNQQMKVIPKVKTIEEYACLENAEKMELRNTLWRNPGLIDSFVLENPYSLPEEELDIVRKWRRFVSGTFSISRYLTKYAIFIGEDTKVYGVLGLFDSLEDLHPRSRLPIMTKAVLLPFKGKIIYDGILNYYNITFGGGIKSSLREQYMVAKQNDRIITTLEPEIAETKFVKPKSDKNWGPKIDNIVKLTEKMRGGPPIRRAAFNLLSASARSAEAAIKHPDDIYQLNALNDQVRKAYNKVQKVLNRAE